MEPLEEKNASPAGVGFKYGIITGAILIIFSIILFLLAESRNAWLSSLSYLIIIGMIIYAHKNFKQENSGFMSYGQGLGVGTILTLTSGFISSIFNYIYMVFVDDSLLRNSIEEARYQLEEKGMSDAEIDQAVRITESMMPILTIFGGTFVMALIGFILSLIISAITKNENPEFH
jgi:hypothetical protein